MYTVTKIVYSESAPDPEIACFLEDIYQECNRRERLELDPLAIVRRYSEPADIEVAGLVCSTLAFGSVELILRACEKALAPLGEHPAVVLAGMRPEEISQAWGSFQYRFCFPKDMIALMTAIQRVLIDYGSLEVMFSKGDDGAGDRDGGGMSATFSILSAASAFVGHLRQFASEAVPGGLRQNLLPDPARGSACKRLFLFLRWMVRHDEIDSGCWKSVDPARLIVPMDTHMVRTCRERLGFLPAASGAQVAPGGSRKGGLKTSGPTIADALRVTAAFRLYAPDDPVKYDFALTRPGIDPRPGDERFGCL